MDRSDPEPQLAPSAQRFSGKDALNSPKDGPSPRQSSPRNVDVIYILGMSFSGTTLLGYLLGAASDVVNAGELKLYTRIHEMLADVRCSCGASYLECSFWSQIYRRGYDVFELPSFSRMVAVALRALLGPGSGERVSTETDDGKLLSSVLALSRRREPGVRYVVDVSKSLWRLDHLARCPGIDLKVVYVRRGIRGNVASFVRRQFGFWKGLVIYLTQHYLATRFLSRSDLDYVVVQYEDLCRDTQAVLDDVGQFLSVDYSDYLYKLAQTDYHVLAGNRGTQQQFIQGFQQVRYDDRWMTTLNGWQKTLLDWLEPEAPEDLDTDDPAQETGASH